MSIEPQRVKLAQLVEYVERTTRQHYANLLEKFIRDIEVLPLDDEAMRLLIDSGRKILAADLERVVGEVSKLAASGMRAPDELLH